MHTRFYKICLLGLVAPFPVWDFHSLPYTVRCQPANLHSSLLKNDQLLPNKRAYTFTLHRSIFLILYTPLFEFLAIVAAFPVWGSHTLPYTVRSQQAHLYSSFVVYTQCPVSDGLLPASYCCLKVCRSAPPAGKQGKGFSLNQQLIHRLHQGS